jgi:phosphoribosylanthranilate isomerase
LQRTRVKICGITRESDALAAAELGVDAIGLVFYAPSPRAVDIAQAKAIADALPPFVHRVGLFVNADAEFVRQVISAVGIDCLQFHGDETPASCEGFGRPYIKALRVNAERDIAAEAARFTGAQGILLDAFQPGLWGGTGATFDWGLIPRNLPRPLILAGGLTAENVATAVATARPFAVDVSGGVEAYKGIKDQTKMRAFMTGVARGDQA